jgi:parallel beta-helix repeat protein
MRSRQPDAAGRQASMCRTTTEATAPSSRLQRRRAAALVLLVSGALAGSGATAWAKPLHCGDTVTTNTTLHADLTDCPGNGLVIGADRVTLNLNGHAITGNLEGAVGIDNSAGHDGVTIMNGAVRNFTNGVLLLEHASGNRLQRLKLVSDNSGGAADNGILIFDSDHVRIDHNSVSGSYNGILLGITTDSTVDRNRVSAVHDGIFLFEADRNVVKRNALTDLLAAGTHVLGGSNNVIERNAMMRTQDGAVVVEPFTDEETGVRHDATGNVFARNSMVSNLFGIALFEANASRLVRNSVTAAGTVGDPTHPIFGVGLLIDAGTGNVVAHNAFTRGKGVGIAIGAEFDSPRPTSDNKLVRNEASRNASDGIRVGDVAQNTTLEGNVANGNAADGIHVLSAATELTRNLASRNGNLGIEAVPGVTDGGGNRAFGNGNPLECSSMIAC